MLGQILCVPPTPQLQGLAHLRLCFVVLRGADGCSKVFRDGSFHTVRGWAFSEGRIAPRAVFHGF